MLEKPFPFDCNKWNTALEIYLVATWTQGFGGPTSRWLKAKQAETEYECQKYNKCKSDNHQSPEC